MKTFIACILAVALALTGVFGSASAASTWDPPLSTIDWDSTPADLDYSIGIKLDKTVYSTENTVINVELLNYSWDTEPDIVEIVWLDTGNVVFYGKASEASITIDIDLNPGEYLLRVRRSTDWDAYWDTWDMGWNENWEKDWNAYWEENSSSVHFSVAGTSDLLCLKGGAAVEMLSETEVMLGARLEWDGPPDGGPYTVTRRDERYFQGEVISIKDISNNCFVDEGLKSGGVYTYTVSAGGKTSNPIVIDLSGLPPMEYAGSKYNRVIVLKIGDPYMYSAEDKQSALDGSELKRTRAIDKNDRSVVPVIIDERTMIPVATLVEEMGGSASWDGDKRVVTIRLLDHITLLDNTLEIPIGVKTVYLNGAGRKFDIPAQIKYGRTLVPIRLLELLGCDVEWVDDSQSVVICYWDGEDIE
ncbi:MAG: hypothetical protein K2O45_11620 [Oscillospiraceae bacterium]|nr:hypothetical protein [Oscillospiraceae bacterium]